MTLSLKRFTARRAHRRGIDPTLSRVINSARAGPDGLVRYNVITMSTVVRYGSGALVMAIVFSLSSTAALAQVPTPSPSASPVMDSTVSTKDFPPEILALIKKGPDNLTAEEKAKVTTYLGIAAGAAIRSGAGAARPATGAVSASSSAGALAPSDSASPSSGTVNCFDYYHFGSVQADFSPTLRQTVPGVDMTFTGEVRNNNAYPIVDGQVYVKIFRRLPGEKFDQENGPSLVDQFPLKEVFAVPAHGARQATFAWHVPENAPAGEYTAAFFFETAKRYNLLGLSFTDDVTGNQTSFSVTGGAKAGVVSFDKRAVTLNGLAHRFAAFVLHFAKDAPVTVSVRLVNPRNETVLVPITWKLYAWDALREEALKDTKRESVTLKPKETKTVSYTARPIGATVSYLVAEATDAASKSILDIRFARDGVDETRINFPSITGYPLKAGEQNSLFSCVHSTNVPLVSGNTLTLTLKDEKERVIHTYTYAGDITSDMMGVRDLFTPAKTYSTFSLTATLKHKGSLVEEVRETYDCRSIDPSLCPEPSTSPLTPLVDLAHRSPLTTGIIAALVLALVLVLAFVGWRVARNRGEESTKFPIVLLLGVLLSSGLFFGVPGTVQAKTVVKPYGALRIPWPDPNPSGLDVQTGVTSVNYRLEVTTQDVNGYYTQIPSDGSALPAGSTFKMTWVRGNYDISWNGTGGVWDSPYGIWSSTPLNCAVTVSNPCSYLNMSPNGYYWYAGLIVPPPTPSPSVTGATCTPFTLVPPEAPFASPYNPYTSICTVTASSGSPVTANAVWPATRAVYTGAALINFPPVLPQALVQVPFWVPEATLAAPFTFTAGSDPAPTMTSFTGTNSLNAVFTTAASDPAGQQIRYGLDWNNDGTIDEWSPSSGYVPSGTIRDTTHTWGAPGTYTVRAYAQDTLGGLSLPLSTTVTASAATVNGACSSTHYLCTSGTPGPGFDNSTTWDWNCNGSGGGTTAACSETKPPPAVNGQCSASHYSCASGTSVSNTDNLGTWFWYCQGSNGGSTSPLCVENKPGPINGQCPVPPVHYNCAAGTSVSNADLQDAWSWTCRGSENALFRDASCYESKYGSCGSTHYTCNAGASTLNDSSNPAKWTWSCQGLLGAAASCSETKPGYGACATTHYTCTAGTSILNDSSDPTKYTWSCEGASGTATCSELKTNKKINVTTNVSSASWSIAGPSPASGVGPATLNYLPSGAYAITWNPIPTYTTPSPGSGNLSAFNTTVNFDGQYNFPVFINLGTGAVDNITSTGARGHGIFYSGMGAVTQSGLVWGTSINPAVSGNKTTDGPTKLTVPNPTGIEWASQVSGLTPSTSYYVRTYAIDDGGVVWYGNNSSFTTTAPLPCDAATFANCNLPPTPSGSSAGSCYSTGLCSYSCNNAVWSLVSNTCDVPPVPTITDFHVSPSRVLANPTGTATVVWSSGNATDCSITKNGAPWASGFGSVNSRPDNNITTQTTYSITCTGPGGTSLPAQAIVNVSPSHGFEEF